MHQNDHINPVLTYKKWSGWRESNSQHQLGRLRYYHYTTPAKFKTLLYFMVVGGGFEPPKLTRQIYSLIPLAAREPHLKSSAQF